MKALLCACGAEIRPCGDEECAPSVLTGCHEPDDPAPVMKTGLLDVLRDLAEP